MKPSVRQLFLGAGIAFCFVFVLTSLAQEAPPLPPASAVAPAPASAVEKPAATDAAAAVKTAPAAQPQPEPPVPAAVAPKSDMPVPADETKPSALRRIDESAPAPAPTDKPADNLSGHHDDRVQFMDDSRVGKNETVQGKVVGIMGDMLMEGTALNDVVVVMGDSHITGTVRQKAVTVMGDAVIEGTVQKDVVVVMGDVTLRSTAKVGGNVVCIGGEVHRDPGATVRGQVVLKPLAEMEFKLPLELWWQHGVRHGRALAFAPGLHWVWIFSVVTLVLYALFALLFPAGVRKCGDMLMRRPVLTVFSPMLALLALPIVFVLLCVTVIGIPVALILLPLGLIVAVLFGRAAIYALVGRTISRDRLHPALAVIVGGLVALLLYLLPFVELLLSLCVAWLGFGCVLAAMFSSEKKNGLPAAVPVAGAVDLPPPLVSPVTPAPAAAEGPEGPRLLAAGLPRAGFWIRVCGLFIDGLIIAICVGAWAGPAMLPILALYGALLWKFRGTTIGGIVCGLQVVRLDDRPLDWPTVVVRALACFLSLIVLGLGFIWAAFDSEKQSWHDKIAGTTVVRPVKRPSLV